LDVLKYLHEKGCPWDGRTPYVALAYFHSEVQKYAEDNGCRLGDPCVQY